MSKTPGRLILTGIGMMIGAVTFSVTAWVTHRHCWHKDIVGEYWREDCGTCGSVNTIRAPTELPEGIGDLTDVAQWQLYKEHLKSEQLKVELDWAREQILRPPVEVK